MIPLFAGQKDIIFFGILSAIVLVIVGVCWVVCGIIGYFDSSEQKRQDQIATLETRRLMHTTIVAAIDQELASLRGPIKEE